MKEILWLLKVLQHFLRFFFKLKPFSKNLFFKPYGTKAKRTPPPKVEKTPSSSTLRRAYWTHPELREQLVHKEQQSKSTGKRRLITGINKTPLSFIAAKV